MIAETLDIFAESVLATALQTLAHMKEFIESKMDSGIVLADANKLPEHSFVLRRILFKIDELDEKLTVARLDSAFVLTFTIFAFIIGIANNFAANVVDRVIIVLYAIVVFVVPFAMGYVRGVIKNDFKYRMLAWMLLLQLILFAAYFAVLFAVGLPFEKEVMQRIAQRFSDPVQRYLAMRSTFSNAILIDLIPAFLISFSLANQFYKRIESFYLAILPKPAAEEIANANIMKLKRWKLLLAAGIALSIAGYCYKYVYLQSAWLGA